MADITTILDLIRKKDTTWRTVNNQPCMHTFIDDFYINLCLYRVNNKKIIAIDVDDIVKGISDLLAKDISEDDNYFDDVYEIYSSSKGSARNIALQH